MPEIPNKFAFCPVCKSRLDGASFLKKGEVMPVPGDISVCVYCETILEFEEGLFVHELPGEELERIRVQEPKHYRMIMTVKDAITQFKQEHEEMFKTGV